MVRGPTAPDERRIVNNLTARQRLPADPRLIALGGGAGGVGASTLVCDLGRLLQRRGRKVLLVDADIGNPNLHIRLGLGSDTTFERWREDAPLGGAVIPADRNRPALLSLGLVLPRPFARPDISATRLTASLRGLDYDDILIDLPAAPDPLWTTLFVLSDVPIIFAPTEAISLLGATRYLRAALFYALLAHPDAEKMEYELLRTLEGLLLDASGEDFRLALASPRLRKLFESALDRLDTYLILSQTREQSERDLGHSMAFAWSYLLDVWPRYLGSVDHDERRWFQQRHDAKGVGVANEGAAETLCEDIVKALLNISGIDAAQPRCRRVLAVEGWQKLGIAATGGPAAMRSSYRRLWEGFRRESPLTQSLLSPPMRERVIHELEDANRELQRWLQDRKGTDVAPQKLATPPAPSTRPGDPIRDARNRAGWSQRELSLHTKIGLRYLEAIEQFEVDELPRPVYLRGYLREIALALDLDGDALMDDYLTAVSETRTSRLLSRTGSTRRS
ncbi:MAG: hypothetical protein ACJAYU_003670 [Bradymonadia bacterium]|jgi:hypothetical protein